MLIVFNFRHTMGFIVPIMFLVSQMLPFGRYISLNFERFYLRKILNLVYSRTADLLYRTFITIFCRFRKYFKMFLTEILLSVSELLLKTLRLTLNSTGDHFSIDSSDGNLIQLWFLTMCMGLMELLKSQKISRYINRKKWSQGPICKLRFSFWAPQ